jgi:hypothetical protein
MVLDPELTPLLPASVASDVRRPLWTQRFAAAAALLMAILGLLLIRSERRILDLQRQAGRPLVQSSREEFRSMRLRGGGGPRHQLIAGQEHYLLVAFVSDGAPYATYRLDIIKENSDPPALLWRVSGKRPDDGAFDISVPGTLLPPGSYRLDLYETDGSRSRLSERYRFTVESAASGSEVRGAR